MPDEDEFSDEDNDHAEAAITFKSRNGNFSPPENWVSLSAENVIRMTDKMSWIDEIKCCFELFVTESIKTTVVNLANLEGKQTYKDNWKQVTQKIIKAYISLDFEWCILIDKWIYQQFMECRF